MPIITQISNLGKFNHRWLILAAVISLVSCSDPGTVPVPVYPNGSLIGPNGPEAMGGWKVVTRRGVIDSGDYFSTGGPFYISIEDSAFIKMQVTQVYMNRDPVEPDRYGWFLFDTFHVSDRFISIDDPLRAYNSFGYVIFIYQDYYGN